jgi:hypothetical protein
LQLAGSANALSSAVTITTNGTGSAGDGAMSLIGTTNQTVGIVTGQIVSAARAPTTYSGKTTVGDGTHGANLTTTQILQNTLTINAGSTVTIAPSGSGMMGGAVAATSSADSAATSAASTDSGSGSSSDPFTAIQAAISSGAISSATGQHLEDRIAEIEQLGATDPGLNVSLLESRILSVLPSSSLWSAAASSSPLSSAASDSSLLATDSGTFASASDSALSGDLALGGDAGPASVPEPSTLILAAMGLLGVAICARRRSRTRL